MRALSICPETPRHYGLTAVSQAMTNLIATAGKVARSTLPVLIIGESGVGKELVARLIHEASGRHGAMVAINCAALPKDLAEAELFGHVRGAFTGATDTRRGVFEEANEGTLCLDEIGELPISLQAKLLRVLEDGLVRKVGASTTTRTVVRTVAATNRDLTAEIAASRFRADLYHRLAGVTLEIPPLRDRPEDIAPLALRFLDEAFRENRAALGSRLCPEFTPELLEELARRPWWGNARELRQAVCRALILGGDPLTAEDFPLPRATPAPRASVAPSRWSEIERAAIASAIERAGTVRGAARDLGVPKSTLADRRRRFGIALPQRNTSDALLSPATNQTPVPEDHHEESPYCGSESTLAVAAAEPHVERYGS